MITPLPGVTTLEARLGDAARSPASPPRSATSSGEQRRGRRRPARADAPVAVDAARHLRRSRSLRPPALEQVGQRRLRHRRRREARRRRLLLAARPRRRRHQRRRPPASARWRSRARWSIIPAVAEAAVVGRAHEIKGQAIAAFVTLKEGARRWRRASSSTMLKEHVVKKIGAIARPDDILFTADLPKTRSGKIMRRLLRDIAEGKALGDTTTLAGSARRREAEGELRRGIAARRAVPRTMSGRSRTRIGRRRVRPGCVLAASRGRRRLGVRHQPFGIDDVADRGLHVDDRGADRDRHQADPLR